MSEPRRPDPERLLDRLRQDQARAERGRLKIFFGASAGAGKTFAMLVAAQVIKRQGGEVVVGVVETHGRRETAQLLEGLEVLPRREVLLRDRPHGEFDLDAALARRPALILVDELAHTNLPGSRHPKRWQDVEELLANGIDVYTSLNVQHLESLNDVVGQITGIRVQETLPDRVFDLADEVTLVDLPAEELLQRLKDGKVYLAEQAERAIRNFFRKGNLIALRELALRRTADRVDAQMREYRADRDIDRIWQAKERLLLCLGPADTASQVRAAARLAAALRADWIAVYVETPRLQRLPEAARSRVLEQLRLAQSLGAETQVLAGSDPVAALTAYARGRNVSKLVLASSRRGRWRRLFWPSLADRLAKRAADLDLYLVGGEGERSSPQPMSADRPRSASERRRLRDGLIWAALVSAALTGVASLLSDRVAAANVVMIYLLGVTFVAARFGRWPGVLASLLSVGAFDFFFVPPKLSFTVSDTQYLLTFVVMLTVALTIGHLAAGLRFEARVARSRERRAAAAYDLTKELAAALAYDQIVEIGLRYVETLFPVRAAILLPDSHETVRQPVLDAEREGSWPAIDMAVAQWAYDQQRPAGFATDTLPASASFYLPLKAPMRTRGVLVIQGRDEAGKRLPPEQQRLLETFAAQIALAIERVHYVEVAQDALVSMESERLRNSLLSAISHDLRTPLTVIVGLASGLRDGLTAEQVTERGAVEAIEDEALRMSGLVSNLLEMARLQAGAVRLNRQWQPLEEVVGAALRQNRRLLAHHRVRVALAEDLPWLEFDAVLMERVIGNLLENAAKYAPRDTQIEIEAARFGEEVVMTVADHGPGLAPGMEEKVFEKFLRAEPESAKPGVGLGLAICRAVMTAHGGRIWAGRREGGGAAFHIALPVGTPPCFPEPDEEHGDG